MLCHPYVPPICSAYVPPIDPVWTFIGIVAKTLWCVSEREKEREKEKEKERER